MRPAEREDRGVKRGAARSGRVLLLLGSILAISCALGTPTEPQPEAEARPPSTTDGILGRSPAPTPSPSASPEPGGPSPSPSPNAGAADCGEPLPPPLSRINVVVHQRGPETWTLDSTPLVGPDIAYCQSIGFTDGRSFCPVRPEGHPRRIACEKYATGIAQDTGRAGPTWYFNNAFCTGRSMGCQNHPENQYQLLVYVGGTFRACATSGVCGEVAADR